MFGSKFSKSRKPRKLGKNATPLDRKQQALREREEQLRREKARCEQVLETVPKLREEQERRRREQFASDPRFARTTPMERKNQLYSTLANPGFGRRRLRSEKQNGLYLFLFLLAVLTSVVFWIIHLLL